MLDLARGLLALLFWPGLITGAALGWFLLWLGRKGLARLQGRQGPPFYQPFFDFVKLTGKQTVLPGGVNPTLFFALPILSLISVVGALALLPAPFSPTRSFPGDLILLLYLLEMPALLDILAGYITRSPYARVGAAREAVMMLGYNLPFLTALIAVALKSGSTSLYDITHAPFGVVEILAAAALLLAIPARIKTTPFSIVNAEQEIVAGPHLEYNGLPLGLFELVHGLELVALSGLFAGLLVNRLAPPLPAPPLLALLLYLGLSAAVVLATTLLAAATARLKVRHALRFYWRWGALAAFAALAVALIPGILH
jgi:NADH-quinone oxidoreductase subunit H